jgi:uncharacterized protein (DUF1810 family)
MNSIDPFKLKRFLRAQEDDYFVALSELRSGCKKSHWIWYIFPQVDGLGSSPMAQEYAIKSKEEAIAYLNHDVLGIRLQECACCLLLHQNKSIKDIMGFPDDLKLRSSMTLFSSISSAGSVFHQLLEIFFRGDLCNHTLSKLNSIR